MKRLLTPALVRPWLFAPSAGLISKTQQLRRAATYSAKSASKKDGHPDHESVRIAISPLAQTITCTSPSNTNTTFPPHTSLFLFFPTSTQITFLHYFPLTSWRGLFIGLNKKKLPLPPFHRLHRGIRMHLEFVCIYCDMMVFSHNTDRYILLCNL